MANELSVTIQAAFAKSPLPSITVGSTTAFSVTVAGTIYKENVQMIGTTSEALDTTDVGATGAGPPNIGWIYLQNLDTTNYVEIAPGNLADYVLPSGEAQVQYLIRINAGERAIFRVTRLNAAGAAKQVIRARANTAPVRLYYVIFEN